MLAEFEERTFENASNAEFSYCYRLGRVYSFGQVQEGRIGLDSALYLEEDYYVILIYRALDFLSGAFSLRRYGPLPASSDCERRLFLLSSTTVFMSSSVRPTRLLSTIAPWSTSDSRSYVIKERGDTVQ